MMRGALRAQCAWLRSVSGSRILTRRARQLYWIETLQRIGQYVAVTVFHPRVGGEDAVALLNSQAKFRG